MVNWVLEMSLMEAHGELVGLGTNGGRKCDVSEGPCNCGAWHNIDENGKRT